MSFEFRNKVLFRGKDWQATVGQIGIKIIETIIISCKRINVYTRLVEIA